MTDLPSYLIDTNVILRFLIQDDPVKALAAKNLVQKARKGKVTLEVPLIVVSETVHTLRSFYGIAIGDVAREVLTFLKGVGIKVSAPAWLWDALEECQRRKVSFGDACIAAEARASGQPVMSFDRDFDAFDGVVWFEPK